MKIDMKSYELHIDKQGTGEFKLVYHGYNEFNARVVAKDIRQHNPLARFKLVEVIQFKKELKID